MPSVNSSSRPKVWPSSTFTTPSLPTFSIASEMTSPISRSRAEIVATRAMSSLPEISFDCDFRFSTTCSTAVSMPRLSAIGFAPAATFFRPSPTLARADDLREHVRLAQDQHFVGSELDLGPAVLREDDLVALGDVHRDVLARLFLPRAGADGEDTAPLRLLLGRVRKDNAADRGLLLLEDLDDQA